MSTSSAKGERLWLSATSAVASTRLWLVFTALLTLILYGPILRDWFQTDDFIFLRAARYIGLSGFVREAFTFTDYDRYERHIDFIRDNDVALPFLSYRPLYFVSLKAMHLVFGENPTGYHAVSLSIHLASTFLVWLIASRLLQGKLGPHLAAIIFALHPAYVPAVAWISDIGTPLATLAVLLALLLFMNSLGGDRLHHGSYVGSIILYGVSASFHPQTISWVAAFAAYFVLVHPGHRDRALKPKRWLVLLPFVGFAAGFFALHGWILAHTAAAEGSFHLGPHMLTHFKNYASGALFPVTSNYAAAHFAAFVVLLLLLASLPAMALLKKRNVAPPLVELFVIVWFLASVAPLLTLDGFFVVGVLFRKLYVVGPSLSILLILWGGSLLSFIPRRLSPYATSLAALLLVAALVGAMTRATEHRRDVAALAVESERFVETLRETYPSLPEGGTVYVVGAPPSIRLFDDTYLVSAIQAFYGRVDAYSVSEEQATSLENFGVATSSNTERLLVLDTDDRIFRYRPSPR